MDNPTPIRRFRPTPAGLIYGLLVVEGLLWLSNWLHWPAWHDGRAMLVGAAIAGVAVMFVLLWYVAALFFRWRFEFSIRTVLVLFVCLLGGPVGWCGGRIYTISRWTHYRRSALAKIDSLASVRPPNITPEHWDEAVGWGRTAFCNLWPWDADNWPDLRNFDSALNERLASGDNLATLQWVWDELEQKNEAGPRYAAQWKPVRAMNPDPITDANIGHLWGLNACMGLDLSRTEVGDTALSCLTGARNLVYVDLSNTRVTDRGLARLSDLRQLNALRLQGCQITDAGLAHIAELTQLQDLNLNDTKVTDEGVKKLQQALPDCKIQH